MSESMRQRPRAAAGERPPWRRLVQLAATLLVAVYMLLAGGTFDAGLRYRVQLLNTLGATVVGLVWLAARRRGAAPLSPTGLEWPLAGLALSQWLALLTSRQPRLGLEGVAAVTMWVAALLILADVLRGGWPRAYVIQALLLLAGLVTAFGLAEVGAWYLGWLRLGQWPPFVFRLNGWLGHANLTAAFLNTLLPLALVRTVQVESAARRLGLALLSGGMLVTLFFTSSRAGWLAGALGLATLVGLALARPHERARLARVPGRWRALPRTGRWLLALGLAAAVVLLARLLGAQAQHITHGPLFSSRAQFWRVAWSMFQLQPFTGAGPGLFPWFYTRWVASPPEWFAPHAHSLPLQILAGSGLAGFAASVWLGIAALVLLAQRWRADGDQRLAAGLLAGLAAFGFQQLFDNLLGSTVMVFVLVVVLALALTGAGPNRPTRAYSHWLLTPLLAAPLVVAAFALRGAALNDRGLALAAQGDWLAAARSFEQAAENDPGLTLYWQQAAYAYTRADDVATALPLWQRAAQDDPYWPLLTATAGLLSHSQATVQQALVQTGANSHLFALNLGVLAEEDGDRLAAQAAYQRALDLRPASAAALFWQQSALRRSAADAWSSARDVDATPLALGRQALAAGQAQAAVAHFQSALRDNPQEAAAYVGLAEAYWALGDHARADAARQAGLRVPVTALEQTLDLHLLAGDWARARGDLAAAADSYSLVFSAVNDYTLFGPGTYAHPQRSWYVFRRQALPADLVPQFARADITPALDARFAWLAEYYFEAGNPLIGCLIATRVKRDNPASQSASVWQSTCQPDP